MERMKRVNVLLTAASRRVALVRAFKELENRMEWAGRCIAVDCEPLSPALFFAHRYHLVPPISDPDYKRGVLDVIRRERISLLVPTMDEELILWGESREELEREGVYVACSSGDTARICRDKVATARFFRERGFPFPETWEGESLRGHEGELRYPLFLKPRCGRGSVDAFRINTPEELRFYLPRVEDPLVQEYLVGREFTVDLLCDFQGRLMTMVPRERLLVRAGVSDRGRTFRNPELEGLCAEVARALEIRGPANLQGCLGERGISFFEVNPRFSGGIQLSLAAGADLPGTLVSLAAGEMVRPSLGEFREGLYMTSYAESLFLEARDDRFERTGESSRGPAFTVGGESRNPRENRS